MTLYIPENLDVDKLIYDYPPNFKQSRHQREKVLYIIDLINTRKLHNKELLNKNFVPISSVLLQDVIPNYKEYLNYLINEVKIIETDNQYIVGKKCKGYKLIEKYRTELIPYTIKDRGLWLAIRRRRNSRKYSVRHLKNLTKWYNENLEIDADLINFFLREEYNYKINNPELWDTRKEFKLGKEISESINPLEQYRVSKMAVQKINNQNYYYNQDNKVFRFHSNLTNIRSTIRNGITYEGKNLKCIDIKNCQPYLSLVLFNPNFWEKGTKKKDELGVINISKLKNKVLCSYTMLGKTHENQINKEFNQYIELVTNGKLYDFLKEQFNQKLDEQFISRKDIKSAVFQAFFSPNSFLWQKSAKPKKIFSEAFPDVYKVFEEIKRNDHSILAVLLQNIESYLILDVIVKRISKEKPTAPLFTIHDSISTTHEYVEFVITVMEEELEKAIGYVPKLSVEEWNKSKIIKYLESYKEKDLLIG